MILFISACTNSNKQLPNEQELLRKELHQIDWTKVDTYPSYDHCDSLKKAKDLQACFFETFQNELYQIVANDSMLSTQKYQHLDSITLSVTILPNAVVELKTMNLPTAEQTKEWDSLLFSKTTQLSPLHAATKRGVPVKTQFQIKLSLR